MSQKGKLKADKNPHDAKVIVREALFVQRVSNQEPPIPSGKTIIRDVRSRYLYAIHAERNPELLRGFANG